MGEMDVRCLLSDEDYRTMFEQEADIVRKLVATKPQDVPTGMSIHGLQLPGLTEAVGVMVHLGDLPSQAVRDEAMRDLGKMLVKRVKVFPLAAFFLSETWVATATKAEMESGDYEMPSKRADRKEAVTLVGLTYDSRTSMFVVEVTRDADQGMLAGEEMVQPYVRDGKQKVEDRILAPFYDGVAESCRDESLKRRGGASEDKRS